MQGNKHFTPKLFTSVNLLDLVPEDNFYRKWITALDLQFLRRAIRPYNGQEGQQSIDPIVFLRFCW